MTKNTPQRGTMWLADQIEQHPIGKDQLMDELRLGIFMYPAQWRAIVKRLRYFAENAE